MATEYDHKKIETKWQKRWAEKGTYATDDASGKPKCYVLDMFPYPSGEGLHVGHPKGYIATDVYSRFKRMNGFETLHPMGWDAFGLPAENFAIKNKVHPRTAVEKNVANFKKQLALLGFNYDWSREINTTDPSYYRWTQWIFLKLFEKGLAYQSFEPINWCPSCQTGLANEDVEADGTCERCNTKVELRPMRQWVLKITAYADRLLDDLVSLPEWPEHIKEQQRNWIGRSEGAEITFPLVFSNPKHNEWRDAGGSQAAISVFTTRPDTLFGATYLVLAPEHPWVRAALNTLENELLENKDEVRAYVAEVSQKTDIERAGAKEKTGVELKGVKALNPATNEEVPIFVADYVLANYGTGAVMAVPAHDERDFAFAKQWGLPVRQVVVPCFEDTANPPQAGFAEVERATVIVFLKDISSGKYALLNWHGSLEGVTTGIMGGIDEGESPEDAVHKEIREEAALTNVRVVKKLPWVIAARYCASHKGENRRAIAHAFLAEVDDLSQQGSISEAESANHTLVWVSEDDILNRSLPEHQKFLWRQLHSEAALPEEGTLINSGQYDGMPSASAKKAIVEAVGGALKAEYRIEDWVFSRQRYWGEPIPIVHCDTCGAVPVPEHDLPVLLPDVQHYEPTGTGESPLASITEWVNTPCPSCKGPGKRETNTMPQWAGSSWYWLRFVDPGNPTALVGEVAEKKWGPVDVYVGGDHAVRHLIYARFWHKFLFDIGVVHTEEPFARLEYLGFILAEDGRKMSKRWGNVINPDDIVGQFGADSLRVYEMFMGPFENTIAWSTNGLVGARRFIERVWRLGEKVNSHDVLGVEGELHRTVKKVQEDIEAFKFNTAISQMMIFVNTAEKEVSIGKRQYEALLQILAPFAPHVTEELWMGLGNSFSIHHSPWPSYNVASAHAEVISIAVQFNGKTRGSVIAPSDANQEVVSALVKESEKLSKYLDFVPKKVIFVQNRVINFLA